jgi:uncharacterized protein (DUF302 family)
MEHQPAKQVKSTGDGKIAGPGGIEYTVETRKPFDEAVSAVEQASVAHGFRVLYTHDVAATLAEKGFPREPLKVVEVCNARYASELLEKDIRTALMLPCPISVYSRQGKTFISTMRPSLIADFFPEAKIEQTALTVETAVRQIIDEARV